MTVEGRGAILIKNYLAISGGFLAFAILVVVSKFIFESEVYSYLLAVSLLGLACLLLRVFRARVLRGFLPYCFAFVLCTAAFPASDAFGTSLPDFVLYAGFIGMLIVLAVLLWRAASYTGEPARAAEKA